MDDATLNGKFSHLQNILSEMGSVVIALSGGVDSAVLAQVAHDVLGEQAAAMTADSPSLPRRELAEARKIAAQIGIRHVVFQSHEMDDPNYAANPLERCYFCKNETFAEIQRLAGELSIELGREAGSFQSPVVCYGENIDDQGDHRPGAQAAQEYGVRAPLKEAGLNKPEIRSLAQRFNLPVWDKPAAACLSSRLPYGTPVTPEKLAQVEAAEDVLWELGFRQCRVRHHGEIARIEVPAEEMVALISQTDQIVSKLRQAGFKYVTLDLAGYRRGSLNEGMIPLMEITTLS